MVKVAEVCGILLFISPCCNFLYCYQGDAFPTELHDNENTLSYYGVTDGAEILMNEIDLKAQEREEKREIEMHNKRIEEQEMDSNALQALQKSEMRARSIAAEHASSYIIAEEGK